MHDSRHRVVRPRVLYVGTPAFLVASENDDATFNLAPASSYWALGQLMVLGLESDGQTIENLKKRPGLTVSFPSPDQWEAVERLAEVTGRRIVPDSKAGRYRHVADKFAHAGLHPDASELVAPPRVHECALQFEAEVRRITEGVDGGYYLVEAEVLRVHADPRILVPGTDHIDPKRWAPIVFSFRHYFGIGEPLGPRGTGSVEPLPAGDEACWLPRVCASCGALVEGELPSSCWRCGELVGVS